MGAAEGEAADQRRKSERGDDRGGVEQSEEQAHAVGAFVVCRGHQVDIARRNGRNRVNPQSEQAEPGEELDDASRRITGA